MTYTQALQYLYNSQPAFHLVGSAAYKPGLSNTIALMAHLGNPHLKFKSVHIAGTNGKGSTSHLLAACFQAAGYKTGLYTSPHLVDYRERIRLDGKMIEEKYVVDFVEKNMDFLEQLHPSFFETTMAIAFSYFADKQVDIAIVEVGLGGLLDSTNIIMPELSVITNIGFDHTEFLGSTLAQIAEQKAGIIKPKVPVVIGESGEETDSVFRSIANEKGSDIVFADKYNSNIKINDCQLKGIYQLKNQRTVLAAIDILSRSFRCLTEDAVRAGFAHVVDLTGLQGRWQIVNHKPLTICDTGHNSHGLRYVSEQLKQYLEQGKQLHIVIGMVSDKDVDNVFSMMPNQAIYYFTQAATSRAIPSTELKDIAARHSLSGQCYKNVAAAIAAAQKVAHEEDVIFVGGSNYVVGEFLSIVESANKI